VINIYVKDGDDVVQVVTNGVLDRTYLTPIVLGDRDGVYKYENPKHPPQDDEGPGILVTVQFGEGGKIKRGSVFQKMS